VKAKQKAVANMLFILYF